MTRWIKGPRRGQEPTCLRVLPRIEHPPRMEMPAVPRGGLASEGPESHSWYERRALQTTDRGARWPCGNRKEGRRARPRGGTPSADPPESRGQGQIPRRPSARESATWSPRSNPDRHRSSPRATIGDLTPRPTFGTSPLGPPTPRKPGAYRVDPPAVTPRNLR